MIYVNPDTDIFILPDGKIQVRKLDFEKGLVEILEISGEDSADLVRIIPEVWKNGFTEQQFYDFFEGKYSLNQISETVEALAASGIVSTEGVKNGVHELPFQLNRISSDLFYFRIDCFVFIVRSECQEEAQIVFHKIARRWGSKSDLDVFRGLFDKSLLIFPAKKVPCIKVEQVADRIEKVVVTSFKLVAVDGDLCLDVYDTFKEAKKSITDAKGYWGRFIARAVNDLGLMASVQEMKVASEPFNLGKKFFHVMHVLNSLDGKAVNDSQLGAGDTQEEACGKAIMESLERFCCRERPKDLIWTSADDLEANRIIDPDRLARYLAWQLERVQDLRNFQKNEEDFWTEVVDIKVESWLIPASHIWYGFRCSDFLGGKSLFWASTNGAAAHFDFEEAAFSGIRELIERDAIMIWWLNRMSPPIVKKSLIGESQQAVIDKIEKCGFEVRLLNMSLDLLPVVMAVARNKNGEAPYFFCGASCNEQFYDACDKALQELEQTVWSRMNQEVTDIDPREIDMPLDHEMFYLNPKNGEKLNFFFDGNEQETANHSFRFDSLQDFALFLERKGFQLFFKDITCDEVKNAGLNIHVVKAVIPDLVPITFGYMTETLGLRRIYELPMQLGLRSKALTESEVLNSYQPHFFP